MSWLEHLLRDSRLIELRHLDDGVVTSGIFSDPDALQTAINSLAESGNLYCTLNRPGSHVEATNQLDGQTMKDADIAVITRLPFDFDPVRQSGSPSTAEELAAALEVRDRFVAVMASLGFPQPACGVSGNGAHAVYRCRIPATAERKEILRHVYQGFRKDFSSDEVLFDPTVRNPSRIWRLYGSTNRKGIASQDRPHRVAQIAIPSRWEGVDPVLLERIANRYASAPVGHAVRQSCATRIDGAGDYRTLDVAAWFAAHGLLKREIGSGKFSVSCPWSSEHTTEDHWHSTSTVVWMPAGDSWATFHCSHAHCEGRGIMEVMNLWGDADRYCTRQFGRGNFTATGRVSR